MRIGLDITRAIAPKDGTGTYTAELLRALIARAPKDDEFLLYSLGEPLDTELFHAEFPEADEAFIPRPGRPHDDALDLFHANTWIVPPGYRGRLVFTAYDLTVLSHAEHHVLGTKVDCLTGLLEAHLSGATFVAISEATADELEKRLDVPRTRIRTIHPAPAPVFAPRDERAVRSRLLRRLAAEPPYLLSVGTLEPRKNLKRLVEAYAFLDEELRRRVPLLLAGGQGWMLDAGELTEVAGMRLLGHVDRDDLVDLYNAATVFAYPSLAEGFGLPVAEAMACGTAVLTSNISSLPEVAGDAAHLVDPTDVDAIREALEHLLDDESERQRLKDAGLARAEHFSWDTTARRTLALYRELAGDNSLC